MTSTWFDRPRSLMNRYDLALGKRLSKVKASARKPAFRQAQERIYDYCMGIDIGLKSDGTFLCIAHVDSEGNVYCDTVEQVPPGEHLGMIAVRIAEHYLRWNGFRFKVIATDQYCLEQFSEEVRHRIPVPVVSIDTNRLSKTEMNAWFSGMLERGTIRSWPNNGHVGASEALARATWLLVNPEGRARWHS